MKQYDAINTISEVVLGDGLVDAVFIKGSIAKKCEDAYSDVDLYFVVSKENEQEFLKRRVQYLRSFDEILHVTEVNFVCPQLVCVFENGLHLDLYTTTLDKIVEEGERLVIYDPKNLLANMPTKPLQLKEHEVGNLINEFSFALLEFYNSFMRQDVLFSYKLAFNLFSIYVQVLRFFEDPTRSKIPAKGFWNDLTKDKQKSIFEISKHLKMDSSLLAVKTMIIALNDLIINLPITIAQSVNYDFFIHAKTIVNGLTGEKL